MLKADKRSAIIRAAIAIRIAAELLEAFRAKPTRSHAMAPTCLIFGLSLNDNQQSAGYFLILPSASN